MSRKPFEPQYGPTPDEESLEREWQDDQRAQARELDSIRPGVSDEYYPPNFWEWIKRGKK